MNLINGKLKIINEKKIMIKKNKNIKSGIIYDNINEKIILYQQI